MSLSVLRFVLTFFISTVSVCCMLPRLSCLLTCHNDVIDAWQNNLLFAPGTDMDRALLRLSHMQKGTYYVQICDKRVLRVRLQPNKRYFFFFCLLFCLSPTFCHLLKLAPPTLFWSTYKDCPSFWSILKACPHFPAHLQSLPLYNMCVHIWTLAACLTEPFHVWYR